MPGTYEKHILAMRHNFPSPSRSSEDACIVYYHANAWNGVRSRQRYLMEAMSKYVPIVYLEDTEERKWHVTYESPLPNVTVVRGLVPMLLSFRRRGWNLAMHAACRWHLRWLRRRYRRVIFWGAENSLRPYQFIPHDGLIFDCIDPCLSDDPQVLADFDVRERELLNAADVVFASADALADRCRQSHSHLTVLNNACEPSEYSDELVNAAPQPEWWPAMNRPIVAYLGTLDVRFDFAAVLELCTIRPDLHFVLAGTILLKYESHIARLISLRNVTCPGRISVEAGRYLISHCSVGLIPFTPGPMNDAINPVKMYAYALLGKPVVGTAIRELQSRPDIVLVGNSSFTLSTCLSEAIHMVQQKDVADRLRTFAMRNTWADRAAEAWNAMSGLLDSMSDFS